MSVANMDELPGAAFSPRDLSYSGLAPNIPIYPVPARGPLDGLPGKGWTRQVRRRASILANARCLVMEEGYSHVALRTLAQQSGVTPPTIYNLIGKRDQVLRRAVGEFHFAKINFADQRAKNEQVNGVLAFVDTLWGALVAAPEYSRQTIVAITQLDQDLDLEIRTAAKRAIVRWITDSEKTGALQRPFNIQAIAEVIHRQIINTVGAWGNGELDTDELRHQLALSSALVLLGLVNPVEAQNIESWLDRHGIRI